MERAEMQNTRDTETQAEALQDSQEEVLGGRGEGGHRGSGSNGKPCIAPACAIHIRLFG